MHRTLCVAALALTLAACGADEGDGRSLHAGPPRWAPDLHPLPPDPPQGVLPTVTSIVLQSDPGDWVGQGGAYAYTQADARVLVSASGGRVSVQILGDEGWSGEFQEPHGLTTVHPGTFANLVRFPFHDPALGGLDWWGEGRGCNALTGWFAVDAVAYAGTELAAIDLRFEQHCEGGAPALRGEVHWSAADPTAPPGPAAPPALWDPGEVVSAGSYVHLESAPGDWIGQGGTYTYTQATAELTVSATGGHLAISVQGDEGWSGDFQAMSTLAELEPGYYGELERYPFHNPARGGLSWSGEGRGCNTLSGWFVVDAVTWSAGVLQAIDLRFEQRCEGGAAALRGKVHWFAGDPTAPASPLAPPPGLWDPGAAPTTASYVQLESDPGDWIGQGATYLYTPASATIAVTATDGHLAVRVNGAQWWYGDFQAMSTLTALEPGYYPNLRRYPFHNPAWGGLDWWGEGRGCNTQAGWFVVDAVAYAGTELAAIDLRFEQHCEGFAPALRGRIHWAP